jgi:hypothetical protein
MGLLTVGGKEIVKKGGRKAANESAANLVKGDNLISKVAGSKTSAANELNLEDFTPRQTYGKFGGKFEQESGKAAREAMEEGPLSVKSGGRLAVKAEEGSSNALTRRTSLAETAAGVRSRAEKDMGMADVVEAAKLKDETLRAEKKAMKESGSGKAAAIAAGIAGVGSLGVIALMDRNESKESSKANKASKDNESTSSNKANESKSDSGSLADKVKDMSAPKAKKTISDFEKAFAEARKAGDKTFSFKGKDFTTRLKEESVSSFNKKFESQEDFPRRLYDSMENAARYESGEMNALAKGGFVKAKPKAHNGNRTSQPMQYNSIDMGKFMKKLK